MASYWIFLEGQVRGPYSADQLIRLRGFDRHAKVCLQTQNGASGEWMPPTQIPELATIFKTIDSMNQPAMPPKIEPKPVVKAPVPHVVRPVKPKPSSSSKPMIVIAAFVVACSVAAFLFHKQRSASQDRYMRARQVIEQLHPGVSTFATLKDYLISQGVDPRWNVEPMDNGLLKVSVSWIPPAHSGEHHVYLFEVNLEADMVRGLNTAAEKFLANGLEKSKTTTSPPPPSSAKSPPKPPQPVRLDQVSKSRIEAASNGDYAAAWKYFSSTRKSEMEAAGMTAESYARLQRLRHPEGVSYRVTNVEQPSQDEALITLLEESPGKKTLQLQQFWIRENKEWRLNKEEVQTMSMESPTPTPASPNSSTSPSATPSPTPKSRPALLSLPGVSDQH